MGSSARISRVTQRGAAILLCPILLSLVVTACERTHVTPVALLSSAAAPGEQLAPMKLDRVVVNIERGQLIGHYRDNNFKLCGKHMTPQPIHWASGRVAVKDAEIADSFYREMKKANYNIVGDPDALFGNYSDAEKHAEFLIGGRIDTIALDVCDQVEWSGEMLDLQSGAAMVDVTWQIYSLMDDKVVLESRTQGTSLIEDGVKDGEVALLLRAFAAAARNLGGDPRFHDILTRKNVSAAATKPAAPLDGWGAVTTYQPLALGQTAPFTTPIGGNMSRIEASVVTVISGDGHGSGFFVAPNLILTNHHVALNAQRLKVRLVNGTEVMATTIRSDSKRDVALLQIESGVFTPLPIRLKPLALTEEVYAVGSPLYEDLAGSVTRGIVSQMRADEHGLMLIQSDALVQPGNSGGPLLDAQGNVVGLSQSGLVDDNGGLSGINFFIPMDDALKRLNLTLP